VSARRTGQPVRVGVIGTGALGFHHARLLRHMPGVAFAGIYDSNPARAAEVAAQLDTVAHPGLAALLDRVDAVTVAVPTPAHGEVGLAVVDRGIALLMEKPLADTLATAEELVRRAASHDALLQVGHVERFNRAVRAAAPYLDEPRFLQIDRLAPFQPRGTDVAVILDLMIHDLDLVLELVRSPVADVRATGVAILTPHVDIANARIEFSNGAIANLTASRVSRERTRKLRIFQPTGYCSLDLAQGSGDFFRLKAGWQGFGATTLEQIVEHVRLEAPEAEPLQLELESFLGAVRGEEEVVVSGAAGAQALALAFRVAAAVQASPRGSAAPGGGCAARPAFTSRRASRRGTRTPPRSSVRSNAASPRPPSTRSAVPVSRPPVPRSWTAWSGSPSSGSSRRCGSSRRTCACSPRSGLRSAPSATIS
jgi:predicted dehydrogenase